METTAPPPMNELSDADRRDALIRFRAIQPFLEGRARLSQVAREAGVDVRTARRWASRYRKAGLAGLVRSVRRDKSRSAVPLQVQHAVEGLALQRPRLSIATIHRQIFSLAKELGSRPPSYSLIRRIVRRLEPGLLSLAHKGAQAYGDEFDLVYRAEAESPNAIWQADHTVLDVLVKDAGEIRKPWLTIVLDDYSRAVAGYSLSLSAPSAVQTALALRQAIWRKSQPGWQVCGIPQILYTDHGSDFTSRHIEQVAADLKIRLIFSAVGRPRGRGKIERFFRSISQILLPRFPAYAPAGTMNGQPMMLAELGVALEHYLVHEYNEIPHSTTGQAPQARWQAGGFLPQMPASLAELDLLLLTVPKTRRIRPDGIHFMRMRYIDPTLAAYVGEQVLLRYDPRDIAEVRVFYKDRFLCRAVCQDLAGQEVPLREIVRARKARRRELKQKIQDRRRTVDALLEARRWSAPKDESPASASERAPTAASKLKRYETE